MAEPVEIHLLNKCVRLLQPAVGFRSSLDSVMVAAACPAQAGERVLDLGCGVGGAAFCLLHRVSDIFVTGIDIQPEYLDLAQQNVALNNKSGRIEFIKADIRSFRFSELSQRVDHVLCNPPFMEAGTHTRSPDEGRALALGHDEDVHLTDWIDCAFHNLQSGGTLTMIHRADMTDKILQGLGKKFGRTEIFPLWPHAGEAAKRVIIRAVKDRRSPAILHAGLVLHHDDGGHTAASDLVLRGGEALF